MAMPGNRFCVSKDTAAMIRGLTLSGDSKVHGVELLLRKKLGVICLCVANGRGDLTHGIILLNWKAYPPRDTHSSIWFQFAGPGHQDISKQSCAPKVKDRTRQATAPCV